MSIGIAPVHPSSYILVCVCVLFYLAFTKSSVISRSSSSSSSSSSSNSSNSSNSSSRSGGEVIYASFSNLFGYIWRSVSTVGETNCFWEWTRNLPLPSGEGRAVSKRDAFTTGAGLCFPGPMFPGLYVAIPKLRNTLRGEGVQTCVTKRLQSVT